MLYSLTKEELNTDRNVIEAMNGFYDDTGDFNTVITSDLELSLGRMINIIIDENSNEILMLSTSSYYNKHYFITDKINKLDDVFYENKDKCFKIVKTFPDKIESVGVYKCGILPNNNLFQLSELPKSNSMNLISGITYYVFINKYKFDPHQKELIGKYSVYRKNGKSYFYSFIPLDLLYTEYPYLSTLFNYINRGGDETVLLHEEVSDLIVVSKTSERTESGFYNDGCWNSIVQMKGDPSIYRHRVETLIIDNSFRVFLKFIDSTIKYRIPGGSTEISRTNIEQAVAECREEARINVKNIKYTNQTYTEKTKVPKWLKDSDIPIVYDSLYTEVYVAEFDSMDSRYVDVKDRDETIRSGRFYNISEVYNILKPEHKNALKWYYTNIKHISESEKRRLFNTIFTEEKLSSEDRKKLETNIFGIPSLRKYPLNDRKHVLSAITYFRKAKPRYRKELAENIFRSMNKYGISKESVGRDNPLYYYLNKEEK